MLSKSLDQKEDLLEEKKIAGLASPWQNVLHQRLHYEEDTKKH